ncbi:hypothetical protein NPIL_631111 [Nephila pilipes]|uniref:Uncharacterized protein n=1 Tax=Nephila pilipes TaxID=299642 RepID=A0A8X6P9W7_NEPPI|nr:hypothetical protein NPIL_631111 [Nephila pilipes]
MKSERWHRQIKYEESGGTICKGKKGIHFEYSEDVFIDYYKQLNRSACHIKPKTIAMIPVQGHCNFSRDSIRWVNFVAHTEGHQILHALNGMGEQKIAGYDVDGFFKKRILDIFIMAVKFVMMEI